MAEKRKAPTSGAPLARAEARNDGQSDPRVEYISGTVFGQGRISSLLGHGREAAVPLRQLVKVTGWDSRAVRKEIETERRRGIPILSDNRNGYYLPETYQEAELCVRSLRHRGLEILKTAEHIERAVLLEVPGQTELEVE